MLSINPKTQLCGLLGNPVEHSLSPALHNAAFQHLDLNFVYLAFPVEDIKNAVSGIKALGNVRGFSVTIPHKVSVMPYLDEIEPTAQHIGSVNTIVKENGRLKGHNTDAFGALEALRQADVALADAPILILGSGGAARAIAFALALQGNVSRLKILGIDEKEQRLLVEDLQSRTKKPIASEPLNPKTLEQGLSESAVVIHCTPVGMYPHVQESCVPPDLLNPNMTVMDIVYNPLETQLLRAAREKGCKTIKGLDMFVNQAVGQFELWTKEPAPVDIMKSILTEHFQ